MKNKEGITSEEEERISYAKRMSIAADKQLKVRVERK